MEISRDAGSIPAAGGRKEGFLGRGGTRAQGLKQAGEGCEEGGQHRRRRLVPDMDMGLRHRHVHVPIPSPSQWCM